METLNIQLQPFMEWLLRTTLQASLLICLILLVQTVLRGRLGIRWHYCLWLLLLVRMVMPWSPNSRVSLYNLIPQSFPHRHLEDIDQSTEVSTILTNQIDQTESQPMPIIANEDKNRETGTTSSVTKSEGINLLRTGLIQVVNVLPIIWFSGAIVLAFYIFAGNFNLWWIIKHQRPLTDQKILDLLEDCKDQVGIKTILCIVPTDKVKSPALFGFIRPRLLLPHGMIETLSQEELRYILLHELAHLKRHDIYIGWLISILQILHWFNPLVWLAFYRMRSDREIVCDALVIARTQNGRAKDYGRIIISLVERFSRSRPLPAMAGILETKTQLRRRIIMITKFKKNSYQCSIPVVIFLATLGFVTLTNGNTMKTDSSVLVEIMPEDIYKDLILYYSFDKDGGTRVVDISGMDFHGKNHGAKWIEEGLSGAAMSFDGEDDYLSVPDIQLSEFSFSAWVETPLTGGAANNRRIFTLHDGVHYYALQGNVGGSLSIVADSEEINESEWQFLANNWMHLVLIHEKDNFKLYKNGTLTETDNMDSNPVTGTLIIGGTDMFRGGFWEGLIDEVAIFNRALSEEEVKQIYELCGLSEQEPLVETDSMDLARFVGTWSGMAVDKPQDGTSQDRFRIELKMNETGRLVGEAFEDFVDNDNCNIENLKFDGNQVYFEVKHRIRGISMGITLNLEGNKLVGEGIPINVDEDRCDITLERQN